MLQETQILTLISTDEVITPTQLRSLLDRFANRFTRKYRLYRFTDEVAIKNPLLHLHGHSRHNFTTFYTIYTLAKKGIPARSTTRQNTKMSNVDIEITIMRCQRATVATNVNVTTTNSSIFLTKTTADNEFLRVNRFDNVRRSITNILTDTAMICKCWKR